MRGISIGNKIVSRNVINRGGDFRTHFQWNCSTSTCWESPKIAKIVQTHPKNLAICTTGQFSMIDLITPMTSSLEVFRTAPSPADIAPKLTRSINDYDIFRIGHRFDPKSPTNILYDYMETL